MGVIKTGKPEFQVPTFLPGLSKPEVCLQAAKYVITAVFRILLKTSPFLIHTPGYLKPMILRAVSLLEACDLSFSAG